MAPTSEQWEEHFSKSASEYEKQSGGVTRRISQQVLALLPPITPSSIIHDNACGPGIVTLDILSQATKTGSSFPTIFATDFNQSMVAELHRIIDDKDLKTVTAQVMDGSNLSAFEDEMFTHSITNFGIFAFPDAIAGVKHILRTLKPGGSAAITTWKYPGNIYFINEILQVLAPGVAEWSPGKEWMEEKHLRGVIEKAGFENSKVEVVERRALWKIEDWEYTALFFDAPIWDDAKAGLSHDQKERWKIVVRNMLKERMGTDLDMVAWVAIARK